MHVELNRYAEKLCFNFVALNQDLRTVSFFIGDEFEKMYFFTHEGGIIFHFT